MNVLIDTHIFLWLMFDTKKISSKHMKILQDTSNNIFLSSLSIAEIMIKKSLNKLDVEFDLEYVLDLFDMKILDFNAKSALLLHLLPYYHHDPFDRMIITQAISHKYKIISVDNKFAKYECDLL